MKRIVIFTLVLVLLLGGCTKPTQQPEQTQAPTETHETEANPTQQRETMPETVPTEPETAYPYTFTDSTGAEVTLSAQPKTVAVLFSSYAEIWQLAGGEVTVTVGESVERGFAKDTAILVDPSAGHGDLDLEALTAAQPDLVIGTADYEGQVAAVEFCREAGIPAASFQVETFRDYLEVLKIFCDLTGRQENYETYGTAVGTEIETILNKTEEYLAQGGERQRILFVRAGSSLRSTKAKTADDNFVCVMLEELGAENIADSGLLGDLSVEVILAEDPDYLFITTMGDEAAAKDSMNALLESEGWRELSCVTRGDYEYLPKELFHFKPNGRWAEGYRYLAEILYPEISFE